MKRFRFILLLLILIFGVSCKIDFSLPEDDFVFCKTTGNDVKLESGLTDPAILSFQWYVCDDESGTNPQPIEGETSSTFIAPGLKEEGISWYFCVGAKEGELIQSKGFIVFNDNLPSIYINTDDGKQITSRSEYKGASIVVLDKKGETDLEQNIEIKGRGHKSWEEHPKKGYNIKLEKKAKLAGVGKKAKKWGLLSSYTDDTKLGNWFASFLGRKVFNYNPWQPDVGYADLYINGDYRGLYQVSELIQINDNRLDIPNIGELRKVDSTLDDGGFIVEFTCVAEYNSFTTLHGASCTMKDPDLDADDECDWSEQEILNYVKKIINTAEASIFGETKDHYSNYIDVDSFVDWYLVNEFCANSEADFETSVFMYYDPSDKLLHAGPNWDFDKSICNKDGIQVATDRNHWIMQLLKDPEFVEKLQKRWNDIVGTSLQSAFEETVKQYNKISTGLYVDVIKWAGKHFTEDEINTWLNERFVFFDNYINNL